MVTLSKIAVTRGKKEPRNPYFYTYYEEKMAAGKTKQQAIVCIMRKLVNVIHYLMRTKAVYVMPEVPVKQAG